LQGISKANPENGNKYFSNPPLKNYSNRPQKIPIVVKAALMQLQYGEIVASLSIEISALSRCDFLLPP
jgi:hypothetical protein